MIKIRIIEAGDRLLPAFSTKLSLKTVEDLQKLGVEMLTNTQVMQLSPTEISIANNEQLISGLNIWTAGVKAESSMEKLGLPNEFGRISVNESLQVDNFPYIFAIGDNAGAKDASGRFLPMVAPVAMQQGRFVSDQIRRLVQGQELEKFEYRDKGSMATIGRHKAVVEIKSIRFTGVLAWYTWLWLHLWYLLGGRNKIGTMADWTWNYLTFDRGNRHILDI